MANIDAVVSEEQGGKGYKWEEINHDDNGSAQLVEAGKYTVTCEGTWTGSQQIDIKYGKESANVADIDTTNLRFTANGSYNIEIGRGYIKPERSSGSSGADVDVTLTPIPR
jgi:hypothetical protein